MDINGYKVAIDNEILYENKLQIESQMVNGADNRMGMLLLSEEEQFVLRIYLVLKEKDYYYISHELQSFAFPTRDSLIDFMERLPEMTALEMLYWLNPSPESMN